MTGWRSRMEVHNSHPNYGKAVVDLSGAGHHHFFFLSRHSAVTSYVLGSDCAPVNEKTRSERQAGKSTRERGGTLVHTGSDRFQIVRYSEQPEHVRSRFGNDSVRPDEW